MPIFEYRCEECHHQFDAFFRRIDEAGQKRMACPKCASAKIRKLFPMIGSVTGENQVSGRQCSPRSR